MGKAGIGNLLRGLDVLKAIDNCREGTIISRKLSMEFCGKPFGLWSSGAIQKLIQHPLLHPIHHLLRTAHHLRTSCDVSQFSVRYEYLLLARPAKARR